MDIRAGGGHAALVLIFDLDGTLVDSFGDIHDAMIGALAAIGLESSDPIRALCRRGVELERFYELATGGRPAAGEELERFVAAYRAGYQARGAAFPGVAATLAALRRGLPGVPFAIATTKHTTVARRVVDAAGLGGFFDVVRGSDGLPHKPDPAVLHEISRMTRRPLDGAIVVGDTDRDVLLARAAGCVAVAVTYGGWPREELAALGPDHLIDRFEELIQIPALAGFQGPRSTWHPGQ